MALLLIIGGVILRYLIKVICYRRNDQYSKLFGNVFTYIFVLVIGWFICTVFLDCRFFYKNPHKHHYVLFWDKERFRSDHSVHLTISSYAWRYHCHFGISFYFLWLYGHLFCPFYCALHTLPMVIFY